MLCCPSSKKDKTKKHSEAVYEATPVIPKQ